MVMIEQYILFMDGFFSRFGMPNFEAFANFLHKP